jgi:hypothetical protein
MDNLGTDVDGKVDFMAARAPDSLDTGVGQ